MVGHAARKHSLLGSLHSPSFKEVYKLDHSSVIRAKGLLIFTRNKVKNLAII